jgi:hypothetical protein
MKKHLRRIHKETATKMHELATKWELFPVHRTVDDQRDAVDYHIPENTKLFLMYLLLENDQYNSLKMVEDISTEV